jgi:carbamoyl-phosphate synthase large subunit
MLRELGIECQDVAKVPGQGRTAMDLIDEGLVDLVINVPREYDQLGRPDGYLIRRRAVDAGVPLITDLQLARAVVEALSRKSSERLGVIAWNDFMPNHRTPSRTLSDRHGVGLEVRSTGANGNGEDV